MSEIFVGKLSEINWIYWLNASGTFPIAAILKQKKVASVRRKMLFTIFKYLFSF